MAVEGPARSSTLTLRKPYMEKKRGEDEGDPSLRMSLTGGASSDDALSLPPTPSMAGKRKQPELSSAGRFKVVSHLVLAMNRFKASLNPTYTFGKRPESSGSSQASGWVRDADRGIQEETSAAPPSRASPHHDAPDASREVYGSRGHRVNYLLRPLPAVDLEGRPLGQTADGL